MIPIAITSLKPADLHQHWTFLRRGLSDIRRKVQPDWIEEDIFTSLRMDAATALIASRGNRQLGFAIYQRLERPFSHKLDLFIWALWNIPLRERLSDDDVPDAMARGIEYLRNIQRSIGAERMVSITSRRAIVQRYGRRELYITYEI